MGNRVFMYTIENKDDNDVISIFNKLKRLNNETTFSLMIRYYVKKDIDSAINILDEMIKNFDIVKCNNKTELLSTNNLEDIDKKQLYSYLDPYDNKNYCFDCRVLMKIIEENPINL